MIPPDIEETINSTLLSLFQQELITNVSTDTLALRTLKLAPLQDDPTTTAPYLVFEKDPNKGVRKMDKGEEEREYGCAEIGGPLRYLLFYEATCGTPLATTRDDAQAAINNLVSRIMNVIARHYDLSGLRSQDAARLVEGANAYLIDNATTRIYGGESTWYGEGKIYWHYPVSWYVF
jgi:hypothetical protein